MKQIARRFGLAWCAAMVTAVLALPIRADVQPGDVITRANVDKVKDLVSPRVEWCINHGNGRARANQHPEVVLTGNLVRVIPWLKERGVPVIEDQPVQRMGATGIGLSIYVTDPDGYVVELKEQAS